MISATVTGKLGGNAELKVTAGGDCVASFSIASNKKVKGEKVTEWVRCSLWGKRAEAVSKYLTKGTAVAVVGELSVRSYEKEGSTRFSMECAVDKLDLLGGGDNASQARPAATRNDGPGIDDHQDSYNDSEIPF